MFKFAMGSVVTVPKDICGSGQAYLVGVEDSANNRSLKRFGDGYIYTLVEYPPGGFPKSKMGHHWPSGATFNASEQQITDWGNSPKR